MPNNYTKPTIVGGLAQWASEGYLSGMALRQGLTRGGLRRCTWTRSHLPDATQILYHHYVKRFRTTSRDLHVGPKLDLHENKSSTLFRGPHEWSSGARKGLRATAHKCRLHDSPRGDATPTEMVRSEYDVFRHDEMRLSGTVSS